MTYQVQRGTCTFSHVEAVFNYHNPAAAAMIKALSKGFIRVTFDVVEG
jgi:hypothetical protein